MVLVGVKAILHANSINGRKSSYSLRIGWSIYWGVVLVARSLHWLPPSVPKALLGVAYEAAFGLSTFLGGSSDFYKAPVNPVESKGDVLPSMPPDLRVVEMPSYFCERLDRGKVQLSFDERSRILKEFPMVRNMPMEAGQNNH